MEKIYKGLELKLGIKEEEVSGMERSLKVAYPHKEDMRLVMLGQITAKQERLMEKLIDVCCSSEISISEAIATLEATKAALLDKSLSNAICHL